MMPKSGQMTLPPKFFSMIYGKLLALHLSAYRTTPYTIYRMNHRRFTILSVTRVVNRNRQSFFCKLGTYVTYSKVPIICTGMYASSAVHRMYCQNCRMSGTYNRSFRVSTVEGNTSAIYDHNTTENFYFTG